MMTVGSFRGQFIAAIIKGIVGMSPDPNEPDAVLMRQFIKFFPEIRVFFVAFEIGFDPVLQPSFLHGFHDILAV